MFHPTKHYQDPSLFFQRVCVEKKRFLRIKHVELHLTAYTGLWKRRKPREFPLNKKDQIMKFLRLLQLGNTYLMYDFLLIVYSRSAGNTFNFFLFKWDLLYVSANAERAFDFDCALLILGKKIINKGNNWLSLLE